MTEESLKYKTKKGLYWTFFDQFAKYGMQFIIGIFMARLLSPSDYGITALPAVFMAIASMLVDSGFSTALVRKKECTEEDLTTAFIYSTTIGLFCYILLYLTSPLIADFYDTPVLTKLIRIASLGFFLGPLITPQNVILQRRLDFKTSARVSIVNKFVSGIVGIVAAYIGFGLWALVISGLCATIMQLFQTWIVVKWLPKAKWSKESFRYLWGFGNKLILTNLIGVLYNNIAPIFIGKFCGPKDLGIYNRAKGYADMPSTSIAQVLLKVSFPVLSKLQDDNELLARQYRKMIRVCTFIIFPLMMMLVALARPLVLTLITEKWEMCILPLQILCFSAMLQPIQGINLNLLQVKGRSDLFLRLEIIKKPICFLIYLISLNWGILGFCFGTVVVGIVALFFNAYYSKELINCSLIRQLRDIAHIFILSFIVLLSVFAISSMFNNMIMQIVIGGITGLIVYIGGSLLFHFDEINDMKYLLSKKK